MDYTICLLSDVLFADSDVSHHRFRLCDADQKRELSDSLEVHPVELTKYNLDEATISQASKIEQWAFFFLFADKYDPAQLRELLPGVEFDQAISVAEMISAKTEDRVMYDQREKALRDYEWAIRGARQQAREEALEEGREEGVLIGSIMTLQGIVGDRESAVEELRTQDVGALRQMLADLQQRIRSRGA